MSTAQARKITRVTALLGHPRLRRSVGGSQRRYSGTGAIAACFASGFTWSAAGVYRERRRDGEVRGSVRLSFVGTVGGYGTMPSILVVGGGMGGLSTAMLLAQDGHEVTLLERDPAPPPASGDEAWDSWERKGINQFRMIHYFLPRFREIAEAELPEAVEALDADGVLRHNAIALAPESLTGGARAGDERFEAMTGRRPMVEAAFARTAAATPNVTIRRGVSVKGLLAGEPAVEGVPHVVGVVSDTGDEMRADLVVDATGRRSPLPSLLVAIGAVAPEEEVEDSGFMYYGRHFRSRDGSQPPAFGPLLQHYDSISVLTLPADNGTWGIGIITSARDAPLRATRDVEVWERVIASYPLIAHWLDGDPITDIQLMAKIEDRHRCFVVDGRPVATGVAPIADSWACTNPSVGRGATIGLIHAQALRDLVRDHGVDDPVAFANAWHDITVERVEPLYRDTLAFDRHRLGEIDAQIAGVPYETEDPSWAIGKALQEAGRGDPELLRGYVEIAGLLARAKEVLARPGVLKKVLVVAATPAEPAPGPSRAELVELIGAAS
jgi:2-polyprenyl-6-methoxyphenol hydroxylase-like FAD-dependent oxidoreductase